MSECILIIEDEKRIADWLERYLQNAGFETRAAYDGRSGLEMVQQHGPDLILLDLMLPGLDGMTICQRMREDSDLPVIMLTARDTQEDRVAGLDLGADDYIVKPFDPNEVVARVKAVLRRSHRTKGPIFQAGPFRINTNEQRIWTRNNEIHLTALQFAILSTFLRHPHKVFTREEIIDIALKDFDGFDRAVDTHIKRIRQLIEEDTRHPRYLKTVYGAGYRFEP